MPMLVWGRLYGLKPTALFQRYTFYMPARAEDLQGQYYDGNPGAIALVYLCSRCGKLTIMDRNDPFAEIPGLLEYTKESLLLQH
ncbi:hypothetical protein JI721_12125 [Alicyclobacillus cycloheptanicus]|uniref:Uncharacterized protein n=1 Tax=Alicyclobacillus cycloheptanicus TaxID=1457 RepID=A0ABT9XLR7_9BACL|nr:hypothetical protein [Alicyclobacillus cycloheptanicus]MDQ0191259.1 hypothetical protein [Alicyclobacillus cycloheptanicus]WDM00463.1 hypothetical protein JI721_12125 [Alicyclobacillus cycloheptanicus]